MAFLCIYFLYITTYWQGWYIMGLVMQVLVIIGMLWLPESPEFYFAKGRYNEAKQVILKIANLNGRPVAADAICFEDKYHQEGETENDDTIV